MDNIPLTLLPEEYLHPSTIMSTNNSISNLTSGLTGAGHESSSSHLEYLSNTALILRHNSNQQNQQQVSKYAQLLQVLEEMGKDIRPTYAGSKSSGERLKRSIVHARILVRECLIETERSARQ